MIPGVVVDVDDTLYLEREYVRSGFRAVDVWCVEQLNVSGVGERAWNLFEQGVRGTTLTDAAIDAGIVLDRVLKERLVQIYREHEPDILMLVDASSLISQIRDRAQIAVITDGPRESQRAKCRALGLFDIADPVVITAEHGLRKPDPEVFRIVERQWSMRTDQLIYIADNPKKDFLAPLALGWHCIRVRRKGSLHEDVETPEGVREVMNLHGLAVEWT